MLNNQPFVENRDAGAFAQAIVDTVREPLLVLDLRVLAASRFFSDIQGRPHRHSGQAMVNGTFRSFECSWKKSCPSMA